MVPPHGLKFNPTSGGRWAVNAFLSLRVVASFSTCAPVKLWTVQSISIQRWRPVCPTCRVPTQPIKSSGLEVRLRDVSYLELRSLRLLLFFIDSRIVVFSRAHLLLSRRGQRRGAPALELQARVRLIEVRGRAPGHSRGVRMHLCARVVRESTRKETAADGGGHRQVQAARRPASQQVGGEQ
jgi:hypothetical protein